ncbi:COX15/CtaA family protein [Streptomyces sp. NPDC051320]|uniref:COX15/CtaA family protein n=1 Tax=Streptomyces sp. NPDC051320 TaxID=3154644 RepID=UPI00342D3318
MYPVPNMTRAEAVRAVRNPLAYIADRWTPAPRTVQRAALAALVMAVIIVVTGGAVRLTASGLGCPTWPECTDGSLTATSAMGLHGAIEFSNRMLTYVLCAAVGWAIIAARSAKPWRRSVTRLGWAQFWVVMGNAVLGGIVVLVGLNPYTVAAHFLLTTALITVAVLTWQRTREGDGAPRPLVGKAVTQLTWLLVVASGALIAVGTVVSGAGRHAGDSSEVARIPVDWEMIAQLHADLAWVVVALTVALWFVLKAVDAPVGPLHRTRDLFLVLMAQGVIGYVQYFTHTPEILVGIHMLGATLVWIGVMRVLLSLRERPQEAPVTAARKVAETSAQAVPAQPPVTDAAALPAVREVPSGR